MAYTPEIVRAAQEHYLTVTPDGKQKYSLSEISEQIEQKSNVRVSRSRLCEWIKKYGWNDQLAAAIALGVARTEAPARSLEPYREEELLTALALGKQSVITRQVGIAEKANRYLEQLKENDRGIPRAAEAATRTNQALFEMLREVGFREETEFEVVVTLIESPECPRISENRQSIPMIGLSQEKAAETILAAQEART